MTSQLFAFRVAMPIEYLDDEPARYTYDPQSQTAVWTGSARAVAVLHCSSTGTRAHCNAYDSYCTTWGGTGKQKCDS